MVKMKIFRFYVGSCCALFRRSLYDSECAIIVTEWDEFRKLKPEDFMKSMRNPAVVESLCSKRWGWVEDDCMFCLCGVFLMFLRGIHYICKTKVLGCGVVFLSREVLSV